MTMTVPEAQARLREMRGSIQPTVKSPERQAKIDRAIELVNTRDAELMRRLAE